jgi:hypothetical protein
LDKRQPMIAGLISMLCQAEGPVEDKGQQIHMPSEAYLSSEAELDWAFVQLIESAIF